MRVGDASGRRPRRCRCRRDPRCRPGRTRCRPRGAGGTPRRDRHSGAACRPAAGDMVEADGNGEFGPQAKRLAGLALGEEDAAAQILAGHVEERIGRLQDRHVDRRRRRARRRARGCRARWRGSGRSWRRPHELRHVAPSGLPDISPARGEIGSVEPRLLDAAIGAASGSRSPPLGGDVRQAEGGATDAPHLPRPRSAACASRIFCTAATSSLPAPSPAPGGLRASRHCRRSPPPAARLRSGP